MNKGTVKWYNDQRGYGFNSADRRRQGRIRPRHRHAGAQRGQKVTYELQTDRRMGKTSAVNLKLAA